jgi:hypothetical protein
VIRIGQHAAIRCVKAWARLCKQIGRHWLANTVSASPRLELCSALVVAPLVEEAMFRLIPVRLGTAVPRWRRPLMLASTALFGLMHVRFGRWFTVYACGGGLVLWAACARTGYWGAVLVHLGANVVDLSLGWRRHLRTRSRS